MIKDRNKSNTFSHSFSSYNVVGFHATSSLAIGNIESVGFLPDKIFTTVDHQSVIAIASPLGIPIIDYTNWLQMGSVTFTQKESDAFAHIAGVGTGQGLGEMYKVLQGISSTGKGAQITLAINFMHAIDNIRNSSSVIYAVDLSRLGSRLVIPTGQPYYRIHNDPKSPMPKASIVSPRDIIARLDII